MKSCLLLISCVAWLGCAAEVDRDSSMYLTGSEEHPITLEDGSPACESPKKVLICHIPPGNPGNAHTICVGAPAVEPHQRNHGDTIGACGDDDDTEYPGEPDAGTYPEDDDAAPPDAATPDVPTIDAGTADAATVVDAGTTDYID